MDLFALAESIGKLIIGLLVVGGIVFAMFRLSREGRVLLGLALVVVLIIYGGDIIDWYMPSQPPAAQTIQYEQPVQT